MAALRWDSNRTVALCGLYQTYRYADAVAPNLRRMLRFRTEVDAAARDILERSRPVDWVRGSFVRVGLHIRRGDFLDRHWTEYGLTVADRGFVNHAVDYVTSKLSRIQLVVATDDPQWSGDVLRERFIRSASGPNSVVQSTSGFVSMTDRQSTAVVLSLNQSAGVDLALLVGCSAVVVTAGSFGWWAAWLANVSTVVYHERWSRVGSRFSREFDHRRYFPPHWTPLR